MTPRAAAAITFVVGLGLGVFLARRPPPSADSRQPSPAPSSPTPLAPSSAPAAPTSEAAEATEVARLGRSRWARRERDIQLVALSPDGGFVATVDGSGAARCERVADGAALWTRTAEPPQLYWRSVAFSPDGALAAVATEGRIELLDASTGELRLPAIELPWDSVVTPVAFTPDGTTLLAGVETRGALAIQLWDVATRAPRQQLPMGPGDRRYFSVAPSRDGKLLGLVNRQLRVFGADLQVVRELKLDTSGLLFPAPDGESVLVSAPGRHVLWDLETGERRQVPYALAVAKSFVDCVAWTAGGDALAFCDGEEVRLLELETGEPLRTFRAPGVGGPVGLRLSADGGLLVMGRGPHLMTFDLRSGEVEAPVGHGSPIAFMAFSDDAQRLLAAEVAGRLGLWELASGELVAQRADGLVGYMIRGAVAPDGERLVFAQLHELKVFDRATLEPLPKDPLLAAPKVSVFAFSPDGATFADGGDTSGEIRLWDAATGARTGTLAGLEQPLTAIAFSADGRSLVSVEKDATIRVWDCGSQTEARRWTAHYSEPTGIATTPDGRLVVTEHKGALCLWDAAKGHDGLLRRPAGQIGNARFPLALTPDGKRAAFQRDGRLGLYDLASGLTTWLLEPPTPVTFVAFSQDGALMATGSEQGEIVVYRLAR